MKKKFLALVLTLAMVLSLVPVTALATEGTPTLDKDTESVTTSQDGVNITKKVVPDGKGNYNLVMEAYVEGTTTETTTSTPLDIVLVLDVSGSMDDPMGKKDSKKRIDALKSAVNAFIDKVAEKNTDADGNTVGHKISIVKFAGEKLNQVGNERYWDRVDREYYNYSQIVKNLTDVDTQGKSDLQTEVNKLTPGGATQANYGMELAQRVLSSDEDSDRDKVVVMFTDGTPTSSSNFEYGVARSAIANSATLKGNNVKVYTVGIFSDANPQADLDGASKTNKYMHAVSSNYPNATLTSTNTGIFGSKEWHWNFGRRAQGSNYYLSATNSTELNNVFQTISNSITTTHVKANASAVLRDTLTEQFVLNGNVNDITVQTAAVTGKGLDGKYAWARPENVTTGIEKNVSGKTVTVKGFNYTSEDNVITKTGDDYSGHKLIVTIPIKVDDTYTRWLAGEHYYNTNDVESNKAGLTGYTKGTDTNASTLLKQSPQVPVTAYTVTYDWGTAPAGENIPTNSNTYLTGKTYPVDTTYAKDKKITDSDGGTWHFSGWTDSNNGVMGTKNVTITGSWTYTEPTPPAPAYTLTYDANGGYFDSDTSVKSKAEQIASAGDHALNYTSDYTPTYTSNDKNVIFLGWSTEKKENVLTKADVNDATTIASSIITEVNIPAVQTVYAVWSLDENGNNIPDVFEVTITYKIENGQWTDGVNAIGSDDITATFQLYKQQDDHTWKATDKLLRDGSFPAGYTGTAGYTGLGWYRNSETTPSPSELVRPTTKVIDAVTDAVTGAVTGAETVFTYKYAPTTPETYTVVLHLEGGSYTTTPDTYTENSDGTYQYNVTKTDAVINPESPSRNNFGFTGWSLSKNAPQTLIGEDANFASLYLEQSGTSGSFDKIDLYAVWKESEPSVTVNKKVETVGGKPFERDKTIARQNDKIVWSVTVTNGKDTPAQVTLTDVMAAGVYTDVGCQTEASAVNWNATAHSWTATVSPKGSSIYYVCYTVTQDDIPNGKIVNTIVKDGESNKPIESDPVSTWDTKQLKSATSLDTSDWTTTVTLTLPTVKQAETTVATDNNNGNPVEMQPIIAISNGSYVIDQIGNEFTFMDGLSLKVNGTELSATQDTTNKNLYRFGTETGGVYPYTVTYTAKNGDTPAQFTWNINKDVYAGTKVTLSYKLKLTTPNTKTGTYGKDDLDGSLRIPESEALYTNESAILYKKEGNTKLAEFPKPSVSYTIKGSSGGHGGNGGGTVTIPDDVPTGLNGKDHYAYVVGYPDGMVYPQKNITRAEVATIFFRLLKDETREANMTKSNSYNDMKDGAWYTCAVSTLSKMGIIKGYEDGSFKPDASISRAEFAAIAARFDPDGDKTPATFSDVSSHWAKDEISIAANHGWIKGYEDGSFKPDQKITRAETMTLVNRVLKRLPETKDDLHKDMKTWPDNQNESAWFYLAVQEATNSHYQKLKKDGTHETWESMRETRDWAALEK